MGWSFTSTVIRFGAMDDKGQGLVGLPMNFKISLAERVRAAAGVPAHIRRKRRIEDLEEALLLALDELYEEVLAESEGDKARAEAAFDQRAHELDLRLLNDLIARHNRWYPIEANLPTDVQTGRLMMGKDPWEPLPEATHDGFVQRWRALRAEAQDAARPSGDAASGR